MRFIRSWLWPGLLMHLGLYELSSLELCIEKMTEFLDEYFDLMDDSNERAFLNLERVAWFEELNQIVKVLEKIKEKNIC